MSKCGERNGAILAKNSTLETLVMNEIEVLKLQLNFNGAGNKALYGDNGTHKLANIRILIIVKTHPFLTYFPLTSTLFYSISNKYASSLYDLLICMLYVI